MKLFVFSLLNYQNKKIVYFKFNSIITFSLRRKAGEDIPEVFLPCSRERGADEQQTQQNTIQHGTKLFYRSVEDLAALLITG